MRLTPSDVEQMTFSTALRGYDLNEVDDFLDQVVVTVRELEDELAKAKALPAAPIPAPVPPPTTPISAPGPLADEAALGRVLLAAQQAADQIMEEAKAESERLLEEAKTEAGSFESEREEKKAAIEAEMAALTLRVGDVRTQLARLATEVADRLDAMDAQIATVEVSDDLTAGQVGAVGAHENQSGTAASMLAGGIDGDDVIESEAHQDDDGDDASTETTDELSDDAWGRSAAEAHDDDRDDIDDSDEDEDGDEDNDSDSGDDDDDSDSDEDEDEDEDEDSDSDNGGSLYRPRY